MDNTEKFIVQDQLGDCVNETKLLQAQIDKLEDTICQIHEFATLQFNESYKAEKLGELVAYNKVLFEIEGLVDNKLLARVIENALNNKL
jgi:hypothetical protein